MQGKASPSIEGGSRLPARLVAVMAGAWALALTVSLTGLGHRVSHDQVIELHWRSAGSPRPI